MPGRPLVERWLVLALGLALAVTVVDLTMTHGLVLVGVLSIPPLLASVRLGPAKTALVAAVSLTSGLVIGVSDSIIGEPDHYVRMATVACAGLLAIGIADLRVARERAVEASRRSDRGRAAMLRSALDCIVGMDVRGRVVEFNPAAERVFGYRRADVIGRELAELIIPLRFREAHRAGLQRAVATGESHILDRHIELTGMRSDGTELPVELTVTRTDEGPAAFTGFLRDITDRKQVEDKLSHQALHDPLTDLPNRTLLMDRIAVALGGLGRGSSLVGILFMDLDRFKVVNDTLGHSAGDDLLAEVARRWRETIRPGDTLARIAGDEFAAVCTGLRSEAEALSLARRLKRAVELPVVVGSSELFVTASIGVALARKPGPDPEAILDDADIAMYEARQEGRGRCRIFYEPMRAEAPELLRTEAELRQALERGEMVVHYQPQVDLRTGRRVGAEALVRWSHPRRGLLEPSEFIPLAEEVELLEPLGRQVLQAACREASGWASPSDNGSRPTISVNISASQFASPGLPGAVERALKRSGLPASALCLEITESTLMSFGTSTDATLETLSNMGVCIAIDDFGTGYSSLNYLSHLSADMIKVDRSFIRGLVSSAEDRAIVSAIVSMGHSLGLTVLAEGVETVEQLEELRRLGCDQAQGFHFGRPVPAGQVEPLLGCPVPEPTVA